MLTIFVITLSCIALSRIIENWIGMSHFSYPTKCMDLLLLQGTLFFSFLGLMDKTRTKPGQKPYAVNQWCVMAMCGSPYYGILALLRSDEWKKVFL